MCNSNIQLAPRCLRRKTRQSSRWRSFRPTISKRNPVNSRSLESIMRIWWWGGRLRRWTAGRISILVLFLAPPCPIRCQFNMHRQGHQHRLWYSIVSYRTMHRIPSLRWLKVILPLRRLINKDHSREQLRIISDRSLHQWAPNCLDIRKGYHRRSNLLMGLICNRMINSCKPLQCLEMAWMECNNLARMPCKMKSFIESSGREVEVLKIDKDFIRTYESIKLH